MKSLLRAAIKISPVLVLGLAALVPTSYSAAQKISTADKAIRLRAAVAIARQYVQEALANPAYMANARKSSVRGGPADIRKVLREFLAEMPEGPEDGRLVFDGSGMWAEACPKGAERYGAVAHGDSVIYVCDTAFKHSDEAIAEALIHEFTHSVGYNQGILSECAATEVEFSALIASGHSPYGNEYSRDYAECQKMTQRMRELAAELWPSAEQPAEIPVGSSVSFSANLLAEMQKQMQVDGEFLNFAGPSDQGLQLNGPDGLHSAPRGPLLVQANNSKDGSIKLMFSQANGARFELLVMGGSQIPLRVSDLQKFGVLISR